MFSAPTEMHWRKRDCSINGGSASLEAYLMRLFARRGNLIMHSATSTSTLKGILSFAHPDCWQGIREWKEEIISMNTLRMSRMMMLNCNPSAMKQCGWRKAESHPVKRSSVQQRRHPFLLMQLRESADASPTDASGHRTDEYVVCLSLS